MGMLRRIEPRRLMVGTTPWAVDQLFASGEQGAWYDPSDMSSLFQDSAGTTPVTAVEQPVGRMLDKSGRGNHASQATTTKRPVLSARVNLLTKTEDFTNAAWVKNGVVNTSDATFAPDGIQSADKQSPANGVGVGAGYSSQTISKPTLAIAYKAVVFAKRGEHDTFGLVVVSDSTSNRAGVSVSLASGAITVPASAFGGFSNASAEISDATNGWYRVELSFTTDTLSSITLRTYGGFSGGGVGDGVAGIYLWGASLTLAADAHLPYQRVNTATDYGADPAKYPAYTQVDGTDDALTSATGGGGTTGFFFSSAVLTTLGGAKQVLWSDAGTNTGYEVSINAANKLQLSVGTGATRVTVESAALSTNTRYVLTAWHDGTNIYVRVNNNAPVSVACGVASAGTAGVTQFCENGASAGYFRGRSYGVVYRKDAAPGPATIDAVIRYLATKSGGPV